MKVGDLVGVGWKLTTQTPYVAVIRKLHTGFSGKVNGYTIYIPATNSETFILPRDMRVLNENR